MTETDYKALKSQKRLNKFNFRQKLGGNLRKARKRVGLRKIAVTKLFGLGKVTLASYEAGKFFPPFELLCEFAKLYAVTVEDLAGGD